MFLNVFKFFLIFLMAAVPILLGSSLLLVTDLEASQAFTVAGRIQAVDAAGKQWDVLLDDNSPNFAKRSISVHVRSGDCAIYPKDVAVRGQLQRRGNHFLLDPVWPNSSNAHGIVHSVNHQLRMDTTARGPYPFRAVGEFCPILLCIISEVA